MVMSQEIILEARRPFVKICGLTRAGDVALCEEVGADWLGFIFHPPSPRCVSAEFVAGLPRGRALRVGVFVRKDVDEVLRVMDRAGLDLAQLHGDQNQAFCRAIGPQRAVKVFWPQRFANLAELEAALQGFGECCRAVLLDAGTNGGGHGQSLDFALLANVRVPRPWLLAGGLGPENIQTALRQCSPNGLDFNSGVEDAPGLKSRDKLRQALDLLGR